MDPTFQNSTDARSFALADRAVAATGILGIAAFWGGVTMAASRYPMEYDWRYMTVSSLLAADRNPAGHLWAAAGIVACGCLGFAWATLLVRLSPRSKTPAGLGGLRAFQFGYFCTALAAALPARLVPLPKAHEILAILAFAGLTYGIVRTFQTGVVRRIRRSGEAGRLWATTIVGAVVSPVLLAASAQTYVFFARPELPWVNLAWRSRGVPLYLSFAFWEWVTCGVLAAYMAILLVSTRGDSLGHKTAARAPAVTRE